MSTGVKVLLIASFLLSGCGMNTDIAESSRNKLIHCKDTRDGEEFTYNTNTVRDAVIGIGAPSEITITDTNGLVRRVNSDQDVFYKCYEVTEKK